MLYDLLRALQRGTLPHQLHHTHRNYYAWVREAATQLVATVLAFILSGLRSSFLQDILLGAQPFRQLVLSTFSPRFRAVLDTACRPPPPQPISFDDLGGYYVPTAAAQVLQLSALHALSCQLQSHETLPPTQLLPSVSHVLLQSEDRRGGKHIEAVAAALASQMGAKFLPVDPMLLALLLAEGLGGGPERYINLVRGGTGSSTARSSGAGGSARSESKIRFAWQALRQGLSAGGTPTVVFLRSADSLICSSWDTYEAFMDVFGPRSQEMHALAGGTPAPMAVLLAGVILPETGAALVSAGSKASGSEGPGPLEKDGWKKDASYKAALGDAPDLPPEEDLSLASLLFSLSKYSEEPKPNPRKLLSTAFPTRIKLTAPPPGPLASRHLARLQADEADVLRTDNYSWASGVAAATGVKLPGKACEAYAAELRPGSGALSREEWEKVLAWAVSLETLQNQRESAKMEPKKGASEGQVEGQPAATNGKKDGHSSGENVELVASGGHFSNNYDANGMRRVLSATNGSGGFWMEDITVKGLRAPIPGLEEHGPAGANRVANTQPLTLGTLFNPLSAAAYALGVLSALLDTAVKLCLEVHNQLREALHGASRDALPAPHSADLAIKSGKSLDVGDEVPSAPMAVSEASLGYGLAMLRRSGAAPRATISPENQYEKQLLAEVLTPETLGGGFRDVGALDEAKRALREAVQLPLQRPELFEAGALASPAKGVLLFGPPGTGKTLLARAAAAESGASFLELSLSSVASKWFGDSTRLVRAAFSLAAKLAPCVLFIDEVDALLGRRSSGGREHEAMREMKNEFMARWDGIRGEGGRRVLVLGATNRPFDLDEAVLRRFTARVSVGLPGKKARKDILDVILAGQALDEGVDIEAVADRCEGFSGADLKQLCMAAAMRPVRELLEVPASDDACLSAHPTMKLPEEGSPSHEKDAGSKELALPRMVLCALRDAAQVGASGGVGAKAPRPVSAADFDAVLQEVRPTVDPDSGVIQELKEWDQKFGSMGRRGEGRALSYFT